MEEGIRNLGDLLPRLHEAENDIANRSFSFDHLIQTSRRGKTIFLAPDVRTVIVLKKLNDNLRRVYSVRQADRNKLIRTVGVLLSERTPFFIIKGDVSTFYESIPRARILSIVHDNPLLTHDSKWLLERIFSSKSISPMTGLPRGLSVSATLSEVYLRGFDNAVRRFPNVYFYGRFVDDFVVFCFGDPRAVVSRIQSELRRLELDLNLEKTTILRFSERPNPSSLRFDFLGYQFEKSPGADGLKIRIAPKKIRKIKTRIVRSILAYTKDKRWALLEKRIAFLTSNYYLRSHSADTPLKAGIYFNYPMAIHCQADLKDLDAFLRSQIFSSRSLAKRR